jgi:hypothetical protein
MSAFEEIDRDVSPLETGDLTSTESDEISLEDAGDSTELYDALLRAGGLILEGDHPSEVGKLLRRICLEEVYRETVLGLRGEDAQLVLDAIQLVSLWESLS